jgi:hypothetical protein
MDEVIKITVLAKAGDSEGRLEFEIDGAHLADISDAELAEIVRAAVKTAGEGRRILVKVFEEKL